MAETFDVSAGPEEAALAAAERAVARGNLVVMPTDTVYGVAARPDDPEATGKIFQAKGRPRDLTLPVLVATTEEAGRVGFLDARALALAERFWPGGLTMVVRRKDSAGWDLGEDGRTVGIRVPDHPVALALLARTGPLAVTSANRSGQPTPADCDGVRASLGDSIAVYLCGGAAGGTASTVVDLAQPRPRILREGAAPGAEILDLLEGTGGGLR